MTQERGRTVITKGYFLRESLLVTAIAFLGVGSALMATSLAFIGIGIALLAGRRKSRPQALAPGAEPLPALTEKAQAATSRAA